MRDCQANREDYALACGLRDRGIPLDEYEFERMKAACLGLEIWENIDSPSTVFNLPSGGAGYELNVAISNHSERPLAPVHIGFEGPGWETNMRLLSDPQKVYPARQRNTRRQVRDHRGVLIDYSVARNTYCFSAYWTDGYEREAALNHRIARSGVLYPGDSVEGWLLAVGEESIPFDYRDRDRLKMRLTVFDQRGRFHRAFFHPMVQRSRQEERRLAEIVSRDERWIQENRAAGAARLREDLKSNLGQEGKNDASCVSAAAGARSSSGK
jgi:hypothetical protein